MQMGKVCLVVIMLIGCSTPRVVGHNQKIIYGETMKPQPFIKYKTP
jgi:hypothetical protein